MRYLLLCLSTLTFAVRLTAAEPTREELAFFENKIRPVLVEHCYECHSEKSKKLRGGLRVDTAEGLRKGGDSGPAVVPGKVKEGHLLAALRYDGDVRMPPKSKLPDDVVADFTKWIAMGAPDPRTGGSAAPVVKGIDLAKGRQWWSFQPLADPAPPAVKAKTWVKTPIDSFILAKLEAKGIAPNPSIDHERLLRRLYFDVIGLPPTPEEIAAFQQTASRDSKAALDALLDRLLDSPHYGERWGRHWLDTMRFAESSGYEFDRDRPGAYHYRDFVIKALNQDMPYDEFVRLQVAGDHLKPGDFFSTAATGFLVAGPFPGQTTQKTLALIRYNHLDDMVSTLGSSLLGLSVGCARCHDHKYDPVPQQDYYRLVATLGRTDSVERKMNPSPEIYQKAKAAFDDTMARLQAEREAFEKDVLPGRLQVWRQENPPANAVDWWILDPAQVKGAQRQGDAFIVPAAGGKNKDETVTFTAHTFQKNLTALRIELLGTGAAQIKDVQITAAPLEDATKSAAVKLKALDADTDKDRLGLAIDADKKTGWAPADAKKEHAALFGFETPLAGSDMGVTLTITIQLDQAATRKLRLALTASGAPVLTGTSALQNAFELRSALAVLDTKPGSIPITILGRLAGRTDPETNQPYRLIAEHAAREPQPTLVPVFSATSGKGGDVHFLIRGEVERKNGVATPGFMQVLMNAPETDKRWLAKNSEPRIALGEWLTDTEAGAGNLLARVIVNRLWQHHMGRGIVATPNDFGAQGEAPSHPELLDWLARKLIAGGWRLKPIHKLILQSAVYQESGELHPAGMKLDPQNRLFWRHAPRRLEAETIRDAVLAVSGTLDPTPFGPGTLDPNGARRSIYLTVKRSQMVPMMMMFDAPEPIQSVGERSITTVPTQSLAFLNSAFVRTGAEKFAQRLKGKDAAIDEAYQIALSRRPTDTERTRMESFLAQQAASYGPTGRDKAIVDMCQVLMCLNEFVYVD
jgi:hypothetical protein